MIWIRWLVSKMTRLRLVESVFCKSFSFSIPHPKEKLKKNKSHKWLYHDRFKSVLENSVLARAGTLTIGRTDPYAGVSIIFGCLRSTADCKTSYSCLFSLRVGSRVWVSPYGPSPGTVAYYTIGSHLWESFWNPCLCCYLVGIEWYACDLNRTLLLCVNYKSAFTSNWWDGHVNCYCFFHSQTKHADLLTSYV